jgi:hypothetical protein
VTEVDSLIRAAVSRQAAWQHVEELSSIDRTSATEGDYQAVRYVEQQLEAHGIPFTTHEFDSYISWPGQATLELLSPEVRSVEVKSHAFSGNTPEGGVIAELASVEGGEAVDYRGIDVRGKIVLLRGPLGLIMPEKVFNAQRHGAAGIVMIAGEHIEHTSGHLHEMIVTPIWGTPEAGDLSDIPQIPAVSIKYTDGMMLKSLLEDQPVRVRLQAGSDTAWRKLKLPVASIQAPAASPEGDDFVLLSGHLDSWYLGTTDNATGDAVLLELARVLHDKRAGLRRSVRIAWWPGHSTGRYSGSTWYADHFWAELDQHCVAVCIVDSPGVRGATVQRLKSMDELRDFNLGKLRDLDQEDVSLLFPGKNGDQSFWGIGVSAMALNSELTQDHEDRAPVGGCGGGWWWHTPTDTIDKGDADVLARDTWVIGSVIAGLASVPLLPFRFDQTLAAFARHLATWQEKAGTRFDLGPVMEHTEALRIRVADLQDRLNTVPEKRLAAVNRSLMRLDRILNPVLYTRVGRFGQDRAVPHPFVPGLQEIDELEGAGDREGFLRTRLVRERNRIQDALFQVERELESLESSLA